MVLTALAALTAPLIDGVDDEGDEPRVSVARVPFWAGAPVNPNQTAVPAFPRQSWSSWKACRPLGRTSCAWIPLQVAHSSAEGVGHLSALSLLLGGFGQNL